MQVSIIITCHNYARYLARSIRSAINQSVPKSEYEVIVVNDASKDETPSVMKSFEGLIKPIHLRRNNGLAAARNKGIRAALGRYVVNLDADDYIDENLVLIESMFLNTNPDWDAVSCDYIIVDEDEKHIKRVNGASEPIACGVMFRTDRLFEVGLYDEKFKMREEEDLRIRFQKNHLIKNIEIPLYRYRDHKNNMTKNVEGMKSFAKFLKTKHRNS